MEWPWTPRARDWSTRISLDIDMDQCLANLSESSGLSPHLSTECSSLFNDLRQTNGSFGKGVFSKWPSSGDSRALRDS